MFAPGLYLRVLKLFYSPPATGLNCHILLLWKNIGKKIITHDKMAAMTANMLSVCVALVIICVVHCHLVPEDENTRQLGQVGSGFLVCVLFFSFVFVPGI